VARRKEATAHANGHSANGSARAGKPPKKFRRLRVVAEDTHGYVSGLRDVYLESSYCPMIGFPGAVVEVELSGPGMDAHLAADLVRWAERQNLPVVYDPPGNLAEYLKPKANGQRRLFE
jgi:hypothetical protein